VRDAEERGARAALFTLAGAIAFVCLFVDLPALTGHQFFNDGATYYTMAWSLAEDFDLRFDPGDLARVRLEYPGGPDGIFLKRPGGTLLLDRSAGFPFLRRVASGEKDRPVFFGKPFLYPLAAAPFVKILGTRGILFLNGLCLGLALVLAYLELRRQSRPTVALFAALVVILGTVAPLYLIWPTPEIFYMALGLAGLVAWRRERPLLSAFLFGLLTYAKPPHLFLAIPLGLEPFLKGGLGRGPLLDSLRRGAVLLGTSLVLFGGNRLFTGEWNYQGGERKTFYGHFPGESPKVTFGNSGFWMTADHFGPTTEGKSVRGQVVRSAAEVKRAFLLNLGYFWVGRFAGVVPYFFPAAWAVLLFLIRGPRSTPGWLALLSLLVSYVFWIAYIPDNWYGGGGTVGNRYFTSLLPLAVLLIPRGREVAFTLLGLAGGAVFVGPLFRDPFEQALRPGIHATREPFLHLPPELTMLNDLSVFTEGWRKKVPFGDPLGRGQPADPKAYWLYFLDDATYGKSVDFGVQGFWLRGGAHGEVVLRALEPSRLVRVRVYGGPGGDKVEVGLGSKTATLLVAQGEIGAVTFLPPPPYVYYDSFVYTLRFSSQLYGQLPGAPDKGGFVQISLEPMERTVS
jgi:hypothetical protein